VCRKQVDRRSALVLAATCSDREVSVRRGGDCRGVSHHEASSERRGSQHTDSLPCQQCTSQQHGSDQISRLEVLNSVHHVGITFLHRGIPSPFWLHSPNNWCDTRSGSFTTRDDSSSNEGAVSTRHPPFANSAITCLGRSSLFMSSDCSPVGLVNTHPRQNHFTDVDGI
jgi:hypothetical protein